MAAKETHVSTKKALHKYDAAKLDEANIRNDSFLQRTFVTYIYPIVARGRVGKLTKDELKMPADQATETSSIKFDACWAAEIGRAKEAKTNPSLLKAIIKAYGWDIFWAGVWKGAWSVFVLLGAFYFVRSLVQYVSDPTKNPNIYNTSATPGVGWILACTFFLDSILVGIALQRMGDACTRAGIKIRAALMTAVYRKTFQLPSVNNEGAGNVVSLVSTDCHKLYEGVQAFHNVWTAPLETAAIIALLLSLTGVYGLPALGIVVFVLPLQYYFGFKIATYKKESVEVSDARVLRMQEILLAIKLVKFYVWEQRFAFSINEVRRQEMEVLKKNAVIKVFNLCLVFAVPPVIAIVIFATYVFNEGPFDSVFSFTILSLFNTLRFPLVVLPKALRGTSEALAAMDRLQHFLLLDESKDEEKSTEVEVLFTDAVLSHHKSGSDDFKLRIPRFEVKPGQIAAVVGRVGSGKSSLFTAILQNMRLESGVMKCGGTIAYVPQSPWVQNLSLRDNILFGLPYDEERYRKVIHACALELDLQILPNGDQSMAGERGINLSGGQRQRVCLARAAYHECDLILLDNPLSAVDQHTALHIFQHCMQNLLKDRAVVWITHQLEMLPFCTSVAVMENGNMTHFGPYDGEVLNQRLPVDHLLFATVEAGESGVKKEESHGAATAAKHAIKGSSTAGSGASTPTSTGTTGITTVMSAMDAAGDLARKSKPQVGELGRKSKPGERMGRKSFQRSTVGNIKPIDSVLGALHELDKQEEAQEKEAQEIIAEGGSRKGPGAEGGSKKGPGTEGGSKKGADPHKRVSTDDAVVKPLDDALEETPEQVAAKFNGVASRLTAMRALMVYWGAGGYTYGAFCFYLFMVTQTCRIYSDLWIRYWAADYYGLYDGNTDLAESEHASQVYILCYMAFVVCFIMLLFCRDGSFCIWHLRASMDLHDRLFRRVLKAPILFFLRTPVGNVLNSFAKDMDTLDQTLPDTMHMSFIYLMILLTSLAIVTVSIYYYAALTAALIAAFVIMQQLYLPAATVLKRWSGETASQVYVHVDESLHGMDVIKAFNAVNYFIQENVDRINQHHLALFNTEQCHLWLAFWCDFFGAVLVVSTCLFSVGLKEDLGAAAVGLAISNTIQVLVFFTWVVRGAADTVSMWDSVERVSTLVLNLPEESSTYKSVDVSLERERPDHHKPGHSNHSSMNGLSLVNDCQIICAQGTSGDMSNKELVEIKVDPDEGDFNAAWPRHGDIKFVKVCLRYYPGAPLALKYVSFHIRDQEKIGVVGRTGSGKTTLLMALFRMFELAFGQILIDGVNIANIPLNEVRSRLAIIPQEPVMFKGTVRSNLDPFEEKPDADLWHALSLVHLKESISELPGGLDAPVAEGGSNFSLGQKQLVCMARCVLKQTRVLVLDEATAAMDLQTDSLIQKTIRNVFAERTTLTIAHRLDTIIFSDRILAMHSGQLKEFDEPVRLLSQPNSMFNRLVDDTGPHASAMLRRMAAEGPRDDVVVEQEEEEEQK